MQEKKTRKKVVAVPKRRRRGVVEGENVRWEKGSERAQEREKEREKEKIQLFFHFTSCKKPFSSHSERAEGKLGELCDSWWNFVQLLLVSQHNLLNHFRKSLNRLRHFFPVCDTRKKEGERKREKKTENFIIFAIFDNLSPRYLYTYIYRKTEFLKIFGYTL